jgi:acyl-CoA reductase-like NAD-dependent aldehyde dehydrogenase
MSADATDSTFDLKYPDRFYIGGEWVQPSTDRMFDVVMPATEEVFYRVAEAVEADVDRAAAAARTAFDEGPWPRLSHAERASYLTRIAEGLRARSAQLGEAWTGEIGVLSRISQYSAFGAADHFDTYAAMAATFPFQAEHRRSSGDAPALLVREPVGVVAAIVPWNAPLSLMCVKAAPALLAGCTVIIKASPEAPLDAYILAEIVDEVGLPPGVLNVLTADRKASEHLVRNPQVDKVSFTGSTAAGMKIGAICGERIARFTLELGGKSAAVVLDDYPIEAAAGALAASTPMLSGQVCAALTRIVVPRRRHDDLVDALSSAFEKIVVGDPFDSATQLGPLAMKRQLERVEGYIAQGKAQGARVATGGGRPAGLNRGYFIEPTVFADVDNQSVIAREEIFGPVVCVIASADEEDAVRIANDTNYGLNASVFTNDPQRAYDVARRLRSGTVGHNGFQIDFGVGFGGFKQSGVGREGGEDGLLPYLESKTLLLEGAPWRTA